MEYVFHEMLVNYITMSCKLQRITKNYPTLKSIYFTQEYGMLSGAYIFVHEPNASIYGDLTMQPIHVRIPVAYLKPSQTPIIQSFFWEIVSD